MNDFIIRRGHRIPLPDWVDPCDMPGDSQKYSELDEPADLMVWKVKP